VGIPQLLDVEDVADAAKPDEKAMVAYLSLFFNKVRVRRCLSCVWMWLSLSLVDVSVALCVGFSVFVVVYRSPLSPLSSSTKHHTAAHHQPLPPTNTHTYTHNTNKNIFPPPPHTHTHVCL
jgi:hypothetical protein